MKKTLSNSALIVLGFLTMTIGYLFISGSENNVDSFYQLRQIFLAITAISTLIALFLLISVLQKGTNGKDSFTVIVFFLVSISSMFFANYYVPVGIRHRESYFSCLVDPKGIICQQCLSKGVEDKECLECEKNIASIKNSGITRMEDVKSKLRSLNYSQCAGF